MSVFLIWYIFIVLIAGSGFSIYFTYSLYTNLDIFINSHNNNNIATHFESIEDGLFNLQIINCISLIIIIDFMLLLIFHFNKKTNINYVCPVLLKALAISMGIYADINTELYTNIDTYVNIYLNKGT
jgi:hypothetical protein